MTMVTANNTGTDVSGIQWVTGVIFLGATFCLVMGVFKKFRASLTLAGRNSEEQNTVQPQLGVYRPYGGDIYSPSYRIIDEVSSSHVPSVSVLIQPKELKQKEIDQKEIQQKEIKKPDIQNVQSNSTGETSMKNLNLTLMKPVDNDSSVVKRKNVSENQGTSTEDDEYRISKAEAKGNNDDSKRKSKADKQKEEKIKKANEEKLKKEKIKQEKEEIARKEKDEKIKAKVKKDKEKKGKGKKTKKNDAPPLPVASVSIDTTAVTSVSGPANSENPQPPPYTEGEFLMGRPASIAKNMRSNNMGLLAVEVPQVPATGATSSSWDMVAAHRQNMNRDKKPVTPVVNNLRVMGNVNKETNNLYTPSPNSPRKNISKGQAKGNPTQSSISSGEESGTEA